MEDVVPIPNCMLRLELWALPSCPAPPASSCSAGGWAAGSEALLRRQRTQLPADWKPSSHQEPQSPSVALI